MTTITIGAIDFTNYFDSADFSIDNNKRTVNTLRAVLRGDADLAIKPGQEILVTIDSNLEFGGLIQSLNRSHKVTSTEYIIYATGYEQILDRRTIGITRTSVTSGSIINELITDYLGDEGITVGNIEDGETVSITKNAISLRDLMDELITTSGFVWFIDNDKKLYFQEDYNYTSGTFPTDCEVSGTKEDLVGYANKVFCVGSGFIGIAEDITEQSKMDARFGSGVYGVVVRDANADTQDKVDLVATTELSRKAFDKRYVYIKTRTQRLVPGTVYTGVTINYTDVDTEDYCIDAVSIRGNLSSYTYTATLEPYSASLVSRNTSWQSKFKQFLNTTNTEIDTSSGAADIEKLTDLDFYSNGFVATYETESLSYRWTKDVDGKITSLTDTVTGTVIPITWGTGVL